MTKNQKLQDFKTIIAGHLFDRCVGNCSEVFKNNDRVIRIVYYDDDENTRISLTIAEDKEKEKDLKFRNLKTDSDFFVLSCCKKAILDWVNNVR